MGSNINSVRLAGINAEKKQRQNGQRATKMIESPLVNPEISSRAPKRRAETSTTTNTKRSRQVQQIDQYSYLCLQAELLSRSAENETLKKTVNEQLLTIKKKQRICDERKMLLEEFKRRIGRANKVKTKSTQTKIIDTVNEWAQTEITDTVNAWAQTEITVTANASSQTMMGVQSDTERVDCSSDNCDENHELLIENENSLEAREPVLCRMAYAE